MKYNRALDLLCAAVEASAKGDPIKAAKLFSAAVGDPSIVQAKRMVNKFNATAYAKTRRVSAAQLRMSASDEGVDEDTVGEEFRIEPQENMGREVQEADFDEMGMEDEFGEEDVVLSEDMDDDEDFGEDADPDELGIDDEDVQAAMRKKASRARAMSARSATKSSARGNQKSSSVRAFARALHNIQVLESRGKR